MRSLEAVVDTLRRDANLDSQRYPPAASYLLRDNRVSAALVARFSAEEELTDVTSLGYSFRTGLQSVCFEFGPRDEDQTAVLVLADHEGVVVAIIDPFRIEQPNPLLPSIPRRTDKPFVLSRPSVETTTIVPVGLQESEAAIRSRVFFEGLNLNNNTDGHDTQCTYETGYDSWCSVTTETFPMAPLSCDGWDDSTHTDHVFDMSDV